MAISFGPDWQCELWASPYRLRFELSQGGSYVNMFTSSYDRARCLARAALPSERVIAVIAAIPDLAAYEVLGEMGVRTTPSEATWMG